MEDPKGVYGGEEHINIVARQGLKKDMPEVYKVADNFYWISKEIGPVMIDVENGMSPDDAVKKFIKNHQELVNEWTS